MAVQYTMTYDKVTPESAEDGDVSERGFMTPGGWEHPIPDGLVGDEFKAWCDAQGPFEQDVEPADLDDVPEWVRDLIFTTYAHGSEPFPEGGAVDTHAGILWSCYGILEDLGGVEDNGDGTFYEIDADQNYRTGEDTRRAVHFEGLTDAQLKLLSALMKADR